MEIIQHLVHGRANEANSLNFLHSARTAGLSQLEAVWAKKKIWLKLFGKIPKRVNANNEKSVKDIRTNRFFDISLERCEEQDPSSLKYS